MRKQEKNDGLIEMQTVTVGEVRKNLWKILQNIESGERVVITRRGKPVAVLTAVGPKKDIEWPDFFGEAIKTKGRPISEIVLENREDRF